MSIRVYLRDHPHRSLALATDDYALIFKYTEPSTPIRERSNSNFYSNNSNPSSNSLYGNSQGSRSQNNLNNSPRCIAEFTTAAAADLSLYRSLSGLTGSHNVHGTLGLVTLEGDVFLCVVSAATRVATIRPGETIRKIQAVEFHCLTSTDYDHVLHDEVNNYSVNDVGEDGFDYGSGRNRAEPVVEHPCLALKKLLSSGTFYYSSDFDVTSRLQDRPSSGASVDMDSFDTGFLWNSYMIKPLVDFRASLSAQEKVALDESGLLTSAMRGFALTVSVPATSSPLRKGQSGMPSTLTLVSRLSCRRAGTRFNARGIDDEGQVANFVETDTIFWSPNGSCFSYTQVRGSVPIFWEQQSGLLPGQQKIQITRSPEATQPAFDKHFKELEARYGSVHIVNLLSNDRPGELELTQRYRQHVRQSILNSRADESAGHEHAQLKETDYDFHHETRGAEGYEAAMGLKYLVADSANAFGYYLVLAPESHAVDEKKAALGQSTIVLQQEGVFRTNCLDCLDRTNLVQTMISQIAVESFLTSCEEVATQDFLLRHSSVWADNGDTLSKIYAGTGALKSSFTRSGKMSLAGALADARKSAQRLYINNFADKGRQNTIDLLLGRLVGQAPVRLYDPIGDYVAGELKKHANEFSSTREISIFAGSFNLCGRNDGLQQDLVPWLFPSRETENLPDIFAIGFQEIVELSPQQIMSTDPARRMAWEAAVKKALNGWAKSHAQEEYVLLRGGQLVGASLSLYVKVGLLDNIKNVEGSLKKTGLSGIAGNKGAVSIRLDFAATSLCFVTAHLAAGFANYEERNRDYNTITNGLHFQKNRLIDDHEAVIWLGDFNYRIGLDDDKVRRLIEVGDLDTLYRNDQLNIQMVHGLTFPHYSESQITFNPTYKYDFGTDIYDTSEKHRIPAWCDRILKKGDILRQWSYGAAPLKFSDHRPVFAHFDCEVVVIDQPKRDALQRALYAARKGGSSTPPAGGIDISSSDEEDLISVEPGLPPASSDRRKWWLDGGQPAKANVQSVSRTAVAASKEVSNPFGSKFQSRVNANSNMNNDADAPHLPPRRADTTASLPLRPTTASQSHSLHPDPTIPPKPSRLASNSSTIPQYAPPPGAPPSASTTASAAAPKVPPPRRANVKASEQSQQQDVVEETGPALPPRAQAKSPPQKQPQRDLLGEDGDGGGGGLGGWQPLQPR